MAAGAGLTGARVGRLDRPLAAAQRSLPGDNRGHGMAAVRLERAGEIAVIESDNPPVNALSHAVRATLASRLDEAMADAAVKAVVIVCPGRTSGAGADINELGKPRSPPV